MQIYMILKINKNMTTFYQKSLKIVWKCAFSIDKSCQNILSNFDNLKIWLFPNIGRYTLVKNKYKNVF